ncbi:MAG: sigma-54-dependent Fis family transcriptional regulator [Deltaproteobacteria bacterium]|nr:sigma-54-dependent Fis family transcriptional regulator [Deltaproteobacteria bacterium]
MGYAILIIDDDGPMRSFLAAVLKEDGYSVEEAKNGREGLARIEARNFDLVITDLRMPDLSGIDVIRSGRVKKPDLLWIIITAYGSIGNAVEAMKVGAADYLTKPLQSPDELRHVVKRVLKEAEAQKKTDLTAEELGKQYPPQEMIFLGEQMKKTQRLVEEVAPTTATVMITGPSGTGKELIARTIHQMSPRKYRPFVSVHCAALTETLLESELFGHERGAFTGAVATRKGRFEMADGGTLFLDEVGEIPPATQVKLLRVLQEREFERVGGTKKISVDVRIIASTNRDLKQETAAGRFREDFYYRLNVFPMVMPSLSQRRDAILTLADHFARQFAGIFGKKFKGFTPEANSALLAYLWPGNIRELQNVIERAVILSAGTIDVTQLNLESIPHAPQDGRGLLSAAEREMIEKVLQDAGGNRKEAAKRLGISLRTLQYRIKEYGIK